MKVKNRVLNAAKKRDRDLLPSLRRNSALKTHLI
jgi:hypothetical protein